MQNTTNAVFNLAALYVIGKSRSGAASAIGQTINLNLELILLLFVIILLTASMSYPATIILGKQTLKILEKIDYARLSTGILTGLIILVITFSGPVGLAVFAITVPIGMLPQYLKIRKTHLMGCILLPVTMYFL